MESLPPDDVAAVPNAVGLGGAAEGGAGAGAAKAEAPADFSELLRDYISHLEDETVILEVSFPADQVSKIRSWKDYRSNFTLTSKYLEDVR